jgi:putative transposase
LFEKELKQRRPELIESWARLPYKERKEARHQEKLRLIDSGEIDRFEYRKDCGTPPTERTVYRMLDPLIQEKERKSNIRNVGWHGDKLVHKTRDGEELDVRYSNQVWQEDHTPLDIMLIDEFDQPLDRPWLTKITDSYSRCIMGIHLSFDSPSSQVTALALRHAILPKQYSPEYKLLEEWSTYGLPENLFTDGGSDFKSEHLKDIAFHLDFSLHLRDRPSEGGIEERSFGTINTDFLSGFYGYLGSNIQERPEGAEGRACFRLKEFHQLLVRYIVDNYNQKLDARMGDQSRIVRWELGLEGTTPRIISERELDICLMRKTRRCVYQGGYLKFENILYRGEYLGGYEGKFVTLRYDPDDITTVWVYYREEDKNEEVFLTRAHATGLEGEKLSLWEAKAASKRIRKAGRAVSNESVLAEVRDRNAAIEERKSKKARKKSEQNRLYGADKPADASDVAKEGPELLLIDTTSKEPQQPRYKVWDYDELLED